MSTELPFETATLYVQRVPGPNGRPAVAAFGSPGAGYVAMFTSLATLELHAGECDWASATGRDLLQLVPDGYGIVLDPAGPHPAVLPASALGSGVVITAVPR
ncbi:MAG: SseB protein N-terminal domain [Actinomycetota bacterium]|nr:SseB protein N-terminal domain [Actinomycetota bacterium]